MIGPLVAGEPKTLAGAGATTPSVAIPGADRPPALWPELVDLITEAVAMPATATARAEVVRAMLLLAHDAVSWRQELVGDGSEESSLLWVVEAADAHRRRMALAPIPVH
jgi:hypothetical protein